VAAFRRLERHDGETHAVTFVADVEQPTPNGPAT
jgi:hypothetical protein